MLEFSNLKEKLITFTFFIIFFIIGVLSFSDYGISIDEDNTRLNGFVSLKYVFEILIPGKVSNINEFITVPSLLAFKEQGIGVIFDLPMAFIEFLFKIEDPRDYYLLRHFFNFLIFFISVYFFYLIAKKRFNSKFIGLLAATLLISSPRIFAESFYNNKDLVFMSLFIISLYAALNFLAKPSLKNIIFFSLTSSLAIDLRILGVILPVIVILLYFVDIYKDSNIKKRSIKIILLFISTHIFFIILFWPYLWENPLENFISVLSNLSNFKIDIYNFYLGEYVNAKNLPWHYPIVWQVITIPIFYLIFFFIGLYLISYRFIQRLSDFENNEFWKNDEELQDLLFLSIYLLPLIFVIISNSTLYDGWRHLYFVYPSFLLVGLSGLDFIQKRFFMRFGKFFYLLIFLMVVPTIVWMVKYHPYQYSYFNIFAGKNYSENFEMDYWGLSNYESLKQILKKNKGEIKISSISTTDLQLTKKFLPSELRKNIKIVDNLNDADYVINNFRDWKGATKNYELLIPENFHLFHEIKINDISINTIYKKEE